MNNTDILTFMKVYLSEEQVMRFLEAQNFLRDPIPMGKDGQGRAWASTNLQFQNELDTMKANIAFMLVSKRTTLFTTKQEMLTEAKDEGMKSAGEREAYCYSSSKYVVQSQEVERMQIVHDRISSLTWVLKSHLGML